MRIVEYEKDTTSIPFLVMRGLVWVSAVFSIIVCVLLIANNLQVTRLDPVHTPALQQLVDDLKSNPHDQALREAIREMDFLSRKAFFTSQHFNRLGIFLLLGGLVIWVVAMKTLRAYQPAPPYPQGNEHQEDLATRARWARQAVIAAGLVLVGLALSLALPWRSPLDETTANSSSASTPATSVPTIDTPQVVSDVPAFPSRQDREKNWPYFLGAAGGRSLGTDTPVDWDVATEQNIRWKIKVPHSGFGSPVVWGDRVFLSGANASVREVYAFDAATGALLWQKPVQIATAEPAPKLKVTEDTGYAASTVATDGTRVFAIFATGELAAFDHDGQEQWARHLGWPITPYGYASSPIVFEDLLIVQFDRKEDSFISGLDVATGEARWQTARNFGPSWATPRLVNTDPDTLVITAADPFVIAYDPRSGAERWRVACLKNAEVAVSPAYADGVVYVAAEYNQFTAIEVATQKILWQRDDLIPGICTPLVTGGLMFFGLTESGIVCLDARTGELKWETETEDIFYASPVLVEDRVYLVDRSGTMHIFKAEGTAFQSLGNPKLGEGAVSTPAVVGNGLFCRGVNHLFRLGS